MYWLIINKGFDFFRINDFEISLQYVIRRYLLVVVDVFSKKGVNLNIKN